MITAENITNRMIRDLRRDVLADEATTSIEADDMCKLCLLALDDGKLPHRIIREARVELAAILNARAAREGK